MAITASRPEGAVQYLVDELRRKFRTPDDVLADLPRFAAWDDASLGRLNGELRQAHRDGRLTGFELGRLSLGIERWRLRANSDDEPTEILDERTADAAALYAASRARLDPAPHELREGVVLRERYVLGQPIARGGQSTIFRAHDLRRDAHGGEASLVAVKVLRDEYAHDAAVARLRREFRQSLAVQHPGTVRMYDLDSEHGTWFIVMELLEGQSLRARINRAASEPIDVAEAVRIAGDCAAVLASAHRAGIPHGDIKPSNLFLQGDGSVKLLDFGAAGELKSGATPGTDDADVIPAAATRVYASPEVLEGSPAEPRDDLFSLACVVFEMLCGRHPFGRLPANEARSRTFELASLPGLSDDQNAALARGLAWSRDERPADIEEWVRSLAPAQITSTPLVTQPAAVAESTPTPLVTQSAAVAESTPTPPVTQPAAAAESTPTPVASVATPPPVVVPIQPIEPIDPIRSSARPARVPQAREPDARVGKWAAVAALVLLLAGGWYLLARGGEDASGDSREAATVGGQATEPLPPPDAEPPGDIRQAPPEAGTAPVVPESRIRDVRNPGAASASPVAAATAPVGQPVATNTTVERAPPDASEAARPVPPPQAFVRRPLVTVSSGAIRVSERAPAAVVVLRRTGGSDEAATVSWRAIDGTANAGSDFATAGGTARFLARQTTRAIYVPLLDDPTAEPDEYFTLVVMGTSTTDIDGPGRVTVSLVDDDG